MTAELVTDLRSSERMAVQMRVWSWGTCTSPDWFAAFGIPPMEVYVDDDSKLTLHGLQQHYVKLKDNEKNRKLFELLDALEFNQVIIFVKSVPRCMALCQLLVEQNFPAIAIHRAMSQEDRLSRYQQFKDFQKRILVATNLFGRGMDIERVNIVFNYDMPEDSDTYLHRVARAGRFGTKGLAITFVSDETDAKVLNDVQDRTIHIKKLDEGEGLGAALVVNKARWDQSWRLAFNKTKVQWAKKRGPKKSSSSGNDDSIAGPSKSTRGCTSNTGKPAQEALCFYVGSQLALMVSMKQQRFS
ncbi:hypothetical protein LSH36_689g00036 [Paralvinella palmiformis]|uniref:RNA helicase n=1 Tax=Paralvinella palmiformis TaxID=53620 RepID=A0AAD9J3F2_9ANNE|nr:hypothetical protein LSH36_689g00036 [Paralvinella palmiformis]